jgi:glycosyltransferase involved in cell wall biosynthesis
MMGPQDRLDLLLSAVQHLVHGLGRRHVRIVLIGDGEDRSRVERLVRELGLQGYVELTGWLPEAEVFERLGTADLGLEPNMEPFVSPVKVMEYMAFGLPFVAFDLEETRTLAEESGEYVEPGDVTAFARSMDLLLDSPCVRARRGAVGRRIVADRVAWEHQETAYLAVYRRLLSPTVTALPAPLERAS